MCRCMWRGRRRRGCCWAESEGAGESVHLAAGPEWVAVSHGCICAIRRLVSISLCRPFEVECVSQAVAVPTAHVSPSIRRRCGWRFRCLAKTEGQASRHSATKQRESPIRFPPSSALDDNDHCKRTMKLYRSPPRSQRYAGATGWLLPRTAMSTRSIRRRHYQKLEAY